MKPAHWPLLLLLSIAGCACDPGRDAEWSEIKTQVREEFPDVPVTTVAELHELLADPGTPRPILLDARSPEEFAVSHLDGALNTPAQADALTLLADVDHDEPIVVYCSVGYRSAVLTRQLTERGFTGVSNLEGSIFEWANSGYPVFQGERAVKAVHPFDPTWGRLLDAEYWPER